MPYHERPLKETHKLPRVKQEDEDCDKLMVAARKGNYGAVARIISGGVPALIPNRFGANAFTVAVRFGKLNVVQELVKGPLAETPLTELLAMSWHGRRPLLIAVEFGHFDVFNYLVTVAGEQKVNLGVVLNECDEYVRCGSNLLGETLLHYVVTNRLGLPLVAQLMKLGASPNAKDRASETVLMRAVRDGLHDEFFALVEAPDLKVDSMGKNGTTALMLAIEHGHEKMAAKLVALGSDVNARVTTDTDATGVSMPFLATRACMLTVVNEMLPLLDPYCIQEFKMRAFEATQKDTMPWYDFTDENQRAEMVKLLTETLFAASQQAAASGKGKNKVRWQYKDEDGAWKEMSLKDTKQIDLGAKNNPGMPFRVKMDNGNAYLIDCVKGTQSNVKGGKTKPIKRVTTAVLTAADIAGAPVSPRAAAVGNVQKF